MSLLSRQSLRVYAITHSRLYLFVPLFSLPFLSFPFLSFPYPTRLDAEYAALEAELAAASEDTPRRLPAAATAAVTSPPPALSALPVPDNETEIEREIRLALS
jgi:hypothetical protein